MFLAAALFITSPLQAVAADSGPATFSYRGEMVDGSLTPITGVFALTFSLYESSNSTRASWTETHWVGVVEGMYELSLGEETPVPEEMFGRDVVLAVHMDGDAELTRHNLKVERTPSASKTTLPDIEQIVFADLAERALSAERARVADDCRTLDGRSISDLDIPADTRRQISELQQQIRDLRSNVASGPQIATPTQTLPRIGGAGGRPYDRACPPNHVVVGARGKMGDLIDSIELVCAPLR